ncbi:MAG TPA: phosphatase PAP2 family protein [Candidatus Eisenbacteria bacterium]|nr:phosphatase PAP2 family protein [Candidatus Eisenbacteria bacterium]
MASCFRLLATLIPTLMNLTDRIYVAVHIALSVLVCARYAEVAHGWRYLVWNAIAIAAIVFLSRNRHDGTGWEFVHDWLPLVFFITVFEEVSYLSLSLRGTWQNPWLVAWESALFALPPGEWLRSCTSPWFRELLEFGYFSFYPLYPAAAGVLWAWRGRPKFAGAFRRLTDSLSVGYVVCYALYLLFPTRSPSHNVGLNAIASTQSGGPFHRMVRMIQGSAGVHGNAFPSAHIMLAFAVLVFAFRYFRRVAPWILLCNFLMCLGAVYDGYHYAVDVVAGAMLGIGAGVASVTHKATGNR